jgi:hypothetical protein
MQPSYATEAECLLCENKNNQHHFVLKTALHRFDKETKKTRTHTN